MQVLFVNSRVDAEQDSGGDNVQLLKTKEALENLGVSVLVRSLERLEHLPAFDIAHIFNIQMPTAAPTVFQVIQFSGKPIALSPIYWDMVENWAWVAVARRSRWRSIARLVGRELTVRLYVLWQHLKAPLQHNWRIQRWLLQKAHVVLPNSVSEANLLQTTFMLGNRFQDRVKVVPNGIDPALYRELPMPCFDFGHELEPHKFVLQVGSINPIKNQLGLIDALFDLPVPLVFVGKPQSSQLDYFESCTTRGRERGNVYFLDRVPYEKLPGAYALAAAHVLPSWRETPGLVSLEAAAAGCPIVTTRIGSAVDYFGDLAWYCHPADPSSIKQAVEAALKTSRSLELRQRILTEFTWKKAAAATLAGYEQALSNS
jgi:glycosyltransferase involved in cell wall biosynthesis